MIKKQPNSAIVPGTGPISSLIISPRDAPLRREEINSTIKSWNRTGQHDPRQQPQRAGQVAHLRGENRTHQRTSTGDSGEVVTKQHVTVGRNVVQTVVVNNRRRRARGVEFHHLLGDVQTVVAIRHQIHRHRGDHDPQGADVLPRRNATTARQNAPMIPRITRGMCLNIFLVSIVKPGMY